MSRSNRPSSIHSTACALRKMSLESENGALLGGEGALVAKIGASRATLRQAARLLEREGLLKVRRGIQGGYFAARPGFNTIEYAVAACLESLDVDPEDITCVTSVLWVEVMRKAAGVRTEKAKALAEHFCGKVEAVRPDASWNDVLEITVDFRSAIIELVKSRYLELILNINVAATYQKAPPKPADSYDTSAHREFVRAWRGAMLMELKAISEGDQELAVMAARHARDLWHRRVWGHNYE